MPHRIRAVLAMLGLFIVLALATALLYTSVTDIVRPFPKVPGLASGDSLRLKKPVLSIGVVSRYPPPVIFQVYQPIMDYLTAHTGYSFELRPASSYQEAVDDLVRGDVVAAFLGTYIYVRVHQEYGIRAILKPLNEDGKPLSRSVLITTTESPIRTLQDLRGKSIALPSAESFSGNWLPLAEFPKTTFMPDGLPTIKHFAHHQSVVYQVLKGNFDAGVVRERVARQFSDRNIRIVLFSAPFPGAPLVVRKDCDSAIVGSLQSALLAIDVRREADRELVRQWDQEFQYGFTVATDTDYDGVRALFRERKGAAR